MAVVKITLCELITELIVLERETEEWQWLFERKAGDTRHRGVGDL